MFELHIADGVLVFFDDVGEEPGGDEAVEEPGAVGAGDVDKGFGELG